MNLNPLNKKFLKGLFGAAFLAAVCLPEIYGCSTGAEAPPVSLPAPVTGRLTVSSPDETGAALVSGDDGSVPAGSLVQSTNESKTSTFLNPSLVDLSSLVAALDFLPGAEAQTTFPDVCNLAFHSCAYADANGSFEMELTATEDDSIAVDVLDTGGHVLSAKQHHGVPHNVRFFVRPVLGEGLLDNTVTGDHKLYALMGSNLVDPKGFVSVVDLPTKTRTFVTFDGTHPSRMAVISETRKAVVLDDNDGFIALVDLTTNNFDAPTKLSIVAPRDLAVTTAGTAYVSTGNNLNAIRKVDLGTMTAIGGLTNVDLQTLIPGTTNIETGALDVTSFTTTITFDLVAFAGSYTIGGNPTPAIGLMDGLTMTPIALTELPAGAVVHDIAFFVDQNKILVSDTGNNQILVYDFTTSYPGGSTSLTLSGAVPDPNGYVVTPRNIIVDAAAQLAFITAKNGNDIHPDSVLTLDLAGNQFTAITPIGLGPTGIVFDQPANQIFVSAFKSRSITVWTVPQLLP